MYRITAHTRIVALDLETTGLSAERDRIVEFAAVCWENGAETGHFQTLVHPGMPIPPAAIAVHGITDGMVRDKPSAGEVLPAFLDFCRQADFLVAHNAPFDMRFLRAECQRQGLPELTVTSIDTCSLSRRLLPGAPNYRLDTLTTVHGLGLRQAHRALEDARDCLALFLLCLQRQSSMPHTTAPATDGREEFHLVRTALESGVTLMIEYQDGRGRVTRREIRPLWTDGIAVEAFCLLRNETRLFSLERIRKISVAGI
jgi:DNA polymerase III epsilon subunit family exonuclease